jgi:DNA-binding response OmpR family regulator
MKLTQVQAAATHAREILVVDADAKTAEVVRRAAPEGAAVRLAKGADQALCELKRQPADVVFVNVQIQDNGGTELLERIRKIYPHVTAVALSRGNSLDACRAALRAGAADILFSPLKVDETRIVLDASLRKSAAQSQIAARHIRLRKVCKRLNKARHEISQQVDLLCNDLVRAYQDLAAQLNQTQALAEFASALESTSGLEGLMRGTLEWVLKRLGPINAAVFLPNSEGEYSLGAYLNLDTPATDPFVEAIGATLAPQAATGGLVHLENDRDVEEIFGPAGKKLLGRTWMAHACFLRRECLGVMVVFRTQGVPLDASTGGLLQAITPVLAERIGMTMHRGSQSRFSEMEDFGEVDDGGISD